MDMVINISLLRIIKNELNVGAMRQNILFILEDLKLFEIPKKPTFMFVHILCPHPPYFFDANGCKPKLIQQILEKTDTKEYVKKITSRR